MIQNNYVRKVKVINHVVMIKYVEGISIYN